MSRKEVLARDLLRRQQRAELLAAIGHARTRLAPRTLLAGWRDAQVDRARRLGGMGVDAARANRGKLAGAAGAAMLGLGLWHWLRRRGDRQADNGRADDDRAGDRRPSGQLPLEDPTYG